MAGNNQKNLDSLKLSDEELNKAIDSRFPFEIFRHNQKEVIFRIMKAFEKKKYVVLEAPTGTGKSPIGITVGRLFGRTHYLTIQKILQDQYAKDFKDLFVMKGRGNYRCIIDTSESCATAICKTSTKEVECRGECIYTRALRKAELNPITLHNFDSFYYQKILFTKRNLMVIDEAHNIEQKFMNFISFTIDNKIIPVVIPKILNINDVHEFCIHYKEVVWSLMATLEKEKEDGLTKERLRLLDDLTRLHDKLGIFITSREGENPINYVFEITKTTDLTKILLKPIEVGSFTHRVYDWCDKILFMSATILNAEQFAYNSGIPLEEMEFINIESNFPIENRPIYYTKELDLKYATMQQEMPKVPKIINKYLKMYTGEKGIIHTHTNRIVDYIRRTIKSSRLLFKDDFISVNSLLEAHARSKDSVIVASGFHEGLDLKDDLARFQIIMKVPYPSLGDKQIKARMEIDKNYYGYLTGLKMVQSYGRGVRTKEDWCDTYVIDKNFKKFYGMNKKMLPDWFREAIEWV